MTAQPRRPDAAIEIDAVGVSIGRAELLRDVSALARPGTVTALVGPNGSGKSTLLRTLFGAVRHSGRVRVGGEPVDGLPARRRVTKLGVLTQEQEPAAGTRTREVVALGRTARLDSFARLSEEDRRIIAAALDRMELAELADRDVTTLSGGERQRSHVARVLAQDTDAVVMDEPTNHLDIGHQLATLRILQQLARDEGRTVLIALHDLGLAARWADQVLLIVDGRLVDSGPPEQVLTVEAVARHFGVQAVWATVAGRRRLIVD